MPPAPRRTNGRRQLPTNIVYRSIQAAGGPGALCITLGISQRTLWRWRRVGMVTDPVALLTWVALIHPEPDRQLALARALVGLPRRPHASAAV
jgi:hypothetical protein